MKRGIYWSILASVMVLVSCVMVLEGRSKFLQDIAYTGSDFVEGYEQHDVINELARKMSVRDKKVMLRKDQTDQELTLLAKKAEQRELALLEQRRRKEHEAKQLKRLMRARAKRQVRKEAFVRKAREAEKKRRKRFTAWREYRGKKRAANALIKAMKYADASNKLHIQELREEVEMFAFKRLKGDLGKYPELQYILEL